MCSSPAFAFAMLIAAWRMLATAAPDERRTAIAARRSPIAGGAGVGLLSGIVGVGGGFLIVPALVLLAKRAVSRAVGTSLAIITLNSLAGFASYVGVLAAKGVQLDWRTLAIVAGGRHHRQPARVTASAAACRSRCCARIFGVVLMLIARVIVVDSRRLPLAAAGPRDAGRRRCWPACPRSRRAAARGRSSFSRVRLQHRALHVEFLARHQVEPGQLRLQHTLEVLLEVAPQGDDVFGHGAGQAAGEVVDQAWVKSHGMPRGAWGGPVV